MCGMARPAFHHSWYHSSLFPNVTDTSTDDPAGAEVDDRTTGGGLWPVGVGHSTPVPTVGDGATDGDGDVIATRLG